MGVQFTPALPHGRRAPRRWFPRLSLTVLPPVAIDVDPELHGRARRRAVGMMLQGVMEQPASPPPIPAARCSRPCSTPRTATARPCRSSRTSRARRSATAAWCWAPWCSAGRLAREAPLGGRLGVMLPNANGAVVTFMALQAFGTRAGDAELLGRRRRRMLAACAAAQVDGHPVVARLRRARQAGPCGGADGAGQVRFLWLEDVRAGLGVGAKLRGLAGCAAGPPPAWRAAWPPARSAVVLFTSGSEGAPKGVVLSHAQHPGQHRAGGLGDRLQPARPGVQRDADVPRLRPDGRRRCCRCCAACGRSSTRRRCITASCLS